MQASEIKEQSHALLVEDKKGSEKRKRSLIPDKITCI